MQQQSIHDKIMSRESGPYISADVKEERGTRSSKRNLVLIVGGVLLLGGLVFGALQLPRVQQVFAGPASARKTPDSSLADTPFLTHAKQASLSACSNVYPVLGQLLTEGAKYDVVSEWDQTAPDERAIHGLVGLEYASKNYTGSAAGVVLAAPNGSNCAGGMIRVAPLPSSCADVVSSLPEGSTPANPLGKVLLYNLGANTGQAMLVPSEGGCVVVSLAWAED